MKKDLRIEIKQKINVFLSSGQTVYLPVGILEKYLPVGIQTVFTFLSAPNEIDTTPLNRHFLNSGKTVCAPRVHGCDISFHQIYAAEGPFDIGAFGLREPTAVAPQVFPPIEQIPTFSFPVLILVPALAFTQKGDRLGRGKGYYDRFLSRFLTSFPEERKKILLVGVSWSFQILESIPVEKYDIPVDCVFTEKGVILCI